jgi:putative ABC transport system substrate-binding protein
MRRIGLAVVLALLVAPVAAQAQQAGKVYRMGVLGEGADVGAKTFADAMREFGWIEGQNLKPERRHADRQDKLPALAAELVELKVDLIYTTGTPATRAAKQATKTIPIVFVLDADPVASGLVASYARPGGNVTGFAEGTYHGKLLEVFKEAVPRVSRVAFPDTLGGPSRGDLSAIAGALGVEVKGIPVNGPEDFDSFFAAAKRLGGAALVPSVAWFLPHLERLGAAATRNRVPSISWKRKFAESGGLLSFGVAGPPEAYPRIAAQIDKILKGAKPADLPVEQPRKFELVINLKTAKALGLTIPQSLLVRADEIIQ